MTANELKEIFSKAEVMMFGRGTPPMYQYYLFTKSQRSASVVNADSIDSLTESLASFKFKEYAPGGVPVFVENEPIDGTAQMPAIENN
jgi:hypothetical protein